MSQHADQFAAGIQIASEAALKITQLGNQVVENINTEERERRM